MPESEPPLIQTRLAAVEYMIECLALATETLVIHKLSPLLEIRFGGQSINCRVENPLHSSLRQVENK